MTTFKDGGIDGQSLIPVEEEIIVAKTYISKAFDTVDSTFLLHGLAGRGLWSEMERLDVTNRVDGINTNLAKWHAGKEDPEPKKIAAGRPIVTDAIHPCHGNPSQTIHDSGYSQHSGQATYQAIHHQCSIHADDVMLFITPSQQHLVIAREVLNFFGNALD